VLKHHDYELTIGNGEKLKPQKQKMVLVLTRQEVGDSVVVQAIDVRTGDVTDLCFIKSSGECSRNMSLTPQASDFYWEGVNV